MKFCISVAYDKNLIYRNEKYVCQIDLEIHENNLFSNNLPVACLTDRLFQIPTKHFSTRNYTYAKFQYTI